MLQEAPGGLRGPDSHGIGFGTAGGLRALCPLMLDSGGIGGFQPWSHTIRWREGCGGLGWWRPGTVGQRPWAGRGEAEQENQQNWHLAGCEGRTQRKTAVVDTWTDRPLTKGELGRDGNV